jgi:hypothetical protein
MVHTALVLGRDVLLTESSTLISGKGSVISPPNSVCSALRCLADLGAVGGNQGLLSAV